VLNSTVAYFVVIVYRALYTSNNSPYNCKRMQMVHGIFISVIIYNKKEI